MIEVFPETDSLQVITIKFSNIKDGQRINQNEILVLNPNKVCSESAVLAAALKWRLFENNVISDLEVVEETNFEVFSLFIDVLQSECVFSRALSLNAESSLGLFSLADKYICPNLETGVLALFFSQTSPENAALMCELASDLLCKPYLAKYATRVFLNGSSEALSEKALQCSVETLTMLISDSNLSLNKESQLFNFIERYKTQHGYDEARSLIPYVHFLQMDIEEFLDGPARSELLTDKEKSDFFLFKESNIISPSWHLSKKTFRVTKSVVNHVTIRINMNIFSFGSSYWSSMRHYDCLSQEFQVEQSVLLVSCHLKVHIGTGCLATVSVLDSKDYPLVVKSVSVETGVCCVAAVFDSQAVLFICKVLLAGDDELISHETLVYMVNVEGLLGEDLFEQPQQKLREELKPEERNLKKILREESNKEQTRTSFNANYKEQEKRCILKENIELIQQVKYKKSILLVSDDKPDIKSRISESTNTQAYFQDRNRLVPSSNLLTPLPDKVIQKMDEKQNYPEKRKLEIDAANRPENKKKWTPLVWNSSDFVQIDKKRNNSFSRKPCKYGLRCRYGSRCKFIH
ncbi:hypothetical protein QYM36_000982 [Artemia franciscana]|uniref:C3H1-type domain-containing protein n=1 Tax=Artemia franciscana TaxID=6661 RepID=A0AA88I576_ARTSF|nr:hypothetical protein QYM36_000982 [Artemia franciscana]